MGEKGRIAKAAGLMSLATFISRILGFVRDMIFALYFGASGLSDTFFAAFRIPNLLRELFAEGSMSAAFIPVLTEYRQKQGEDAARRLISVTFTFILIVAGAVCLLGIAAAPFIVTVIAPGFIGSPDKFALTVFLTRVMFPFLLFVSLAALVMGALNTKKVFFVPAMAPAMLNIVLIMSIVFFESRAEQPILAAALGVMVGGFVQFAFQLPSFYRHGYTLGFDTAFGHPGLKKMAALLLPATLALSVSQINIAVSNILASFLPAGSITYLFYSMRLIQFPIGIFGVAMGTAILPALSSHAVKGDMEGLRDDFSFALRLLFFIAVPSMAGLIALRGPIVNLLFQRGQFDYAATAGTAEALLYYSLGIWSIVGVRITASAFYSMQDTKTPVRTAVVGMLINILFSVALMGSMRHAGLALANSIASWINFMMLFYLLRKKLGRVDGRRIASSFCKILFASVIMGGCGWAFLHGDIWLRSGGSLEKIAYFSTVFAGCILIYLVICYALRCEEMEYAVTKMRRRFGRATG